ncbi:MAG: hypothetical protein Q8920_01960 [Bacillota bacterium]|nr:hypothetical protein [Bacillota bacterium]
MEKKRILKLISLLIIALMIFQLIPSTLNCIEGLQGHTQNSKASLSTASIQTDASFIGRENQKTSAQNIQLRNTSIYLPKISCVDISNFCVSFQEMPFDFRKVIRQSIPHYFNGSKYKNNHFAI